MARPSPETALAEVCAERRPQAPGAHRCPVRAHTFGRLMTLLMTHTGSYFHVLTLVLLQACYRIHVRIIFIPFFFVCYRPSCVSEKNELTLNLKTIDA